MKKSRPTAEKRAGQNERRRLANRGVKSRIRTALKKVSAEPTSDNLSFVYSGIDKAVKKGTLHKKTAARMKSRLARSVSKEAGSKAAEQKETNPAG